MSHLCFGAKKLFASPRYTCLKPSLFCCIMGCGTISEKQQKQVFMDNPIRRPLIQYGDLFVWNGDHSDLPLFFLGTETP